MLTREVYARAERIDAYGVLLALFAVLWTLDVATTLAGFDLGWGEGAGIIALAMLGFAGAFVVKFVWGFVLIAASLIGRRYAERTTDATLAILCGLMLGVVCWNVAHVLASLLVLR